MWHCTWCLLSDSHSQIQPNMNTIPLDNLNHGDYTASQIRLHRQQRHGGVLSRHSQYAASTASYYSSSNSLTAASEIQQGYYSSSQAPDDHYDSSDYRVRRERGGGERMIYLCFFTGWLWQWLFPWLLSALSQPSLSQWPIRRDVCGKSHDLVTWGQPPLIAIFFSSAGGIAIIMSTINSFLIFNHPIFFWYFMSAGQLTNLCIFIKLIFHCLSTGAFVLGHSQFSFSYPSSL